MLATLMLTFRLWSPFGDYFKPEFYAVWQDVAAYDRAASQLAEMFEKNFEAYASGCGADVAEAGPKVAAVVG